MIAYGAGGALETVTDKTGLFFREQTVASMEAAMRAFDRWEADFRPAAARLQAERFSRARFLTQRREQVDAL